MSSDEAVLPLTSSDMTSIAEGTNVNIATAPAATQFGQTGTVSSNSSTLGQDSMLAKLPRELLDHVSSFLPTLDFNNLRLTCKLVENKIFPYWSKTFFRKKQFMMTAFSLQTLVDISRHATLGPCITHLIIGLDYFKSLGTPVALGLDDYQQFKDACEAQEVLLDTGLAVQLLTTALLNLPSLDNIDLRNFNSRTRYRDIDDSSNPSGSYSFWKSYGHSRVPQWSHHLSEPRSLATLIPDFREGGDIRRSNFVNRVFSIILTALGQSASPIRGLEVLIRKFRHFNFITLNDTAFTVSPMLEEGISTTNLPSVLSHLTKLYIDVKLGQSSLQQSGPYYSYPAEDVCHVPKCAEDVADPASTNLRRFLALTPKLVLLRLNNRNPAIRGGARFLSWLALSPENPFGPNIEARWGLSNPEPVSLPLRRLDLGDVLLRSSTLVALFKKFNRLRCCSLRHVHLQLDSFQIYEYDNGHQKGSVWATFFRELADVAPKLEQLFIRNVTESPGPRSSYDYRAIFYPADTTADHSASYQIELLAVDKGVLEALADNTWVEDTWIKTHRTFSGNDDASVEDGEDSLVDIEHLSNVDEEEEDQDEGDQGV